MHSFKYQGVIPSTISYNGAPVKTVLFNGVKVWPSVEAGSQYFSYQFNGEFVVPESVTILQVVANNGDSSMTQSAYIRVKPGQHLKLRAEFHYPGNHPTHGSTLWFINDTRVIKIYGHHQGMTIYWSDEINNYTGTISYDFT